MNFSWKHLSFALKDEILYLTRFGNMEFPEDYRGSLLAEVQVEGGHKNSHSGAKAIFSSEGSRAKYVSHEATDDRLTVVMRSPVTEIKVIFDAYRDCNTLRIHTEVTNVTGGAIKLEEVARTFGVSVSFLSHEFVKYTGRSVYDYVLYRRIRYAKQLIAAGTPLNEVAYQCGFNDYSSFLRSFTKMTGMSPSAYRKSGAGAIGGG